MSRCGAVEKQGRGAKEGKGGRNGLWAYLRVGEAIDRVKDLLAYDLGK